MKHLGFLTALLALPFAAFGGPAPDDAQTGCGTAAATACEGPAVLPEQSAAAAYNVIGSPDAPVGIVEFSDLQCQFCARYALQTFPEIKRAYIDTGKVRYVVRDFPLPMHAQAVPAAVAARCAGQQGKFWQFRDAVYAGLSHLPPPTLEQVAQQLQLDLAKFATCRSDSAEQAAVLESQAAARQGNVSSTPTFFIGRFAAAKSPPKVIEGARPYAEFAAAIDAALASGQ